MNCQNCKKRTYINKQSPDLTEDATDGVFVNKGDFDDIVVQVPQVQGVRQSVGMLQADEKRLENDGKCFQLETQFRDTSREHSIPVHDTESTHIDHHQRDSTCTTVITDDELINDDEGEIEEGEQGGDRAIHARYGNRMQAMTEKELRRLMEENSGKYVVYDGKIITPGSIKQLNYDTIVRIVDKMMGGGRKKGQKKQNKEETTSSSESDALPDMFMNLVKQDDDEGNSMFQTMTQLDDEMIQEAMNKMRQAFDENSKKFGMEKLSFEAVERIDFRKQKLSKAINQGTARESNAKGGTTRRRSEAVQRRTETNHD